MADKITYDRPVNARLIVRLENGEEWNATPDDLTRFGLVRRLDAYGAFDDRLRTLLDDAGLIDREATEAELNPVRYLVETAICYPELLDHPENVETWQQIVVLERALRASRMNDTILDEVPRG
jgi:hypothetical protein